MQLLRIDDALKSSLLLNFLKIVSTCQNLLLGFRKRLAIVEVIARARLLSPLV